MPREYQEVEYLESRGTQYIDTGLAAYIGMTIDVSFMYTSINASRSNQQIFGTYQDTDYVLRGGVKYISNTQFDTWSFSSSKYTPSTPSVNRLTTLTAISGHNTIYSFYLFGQNESNRNTSNTKARIYSIRFGNDRNFIPCYRKSDNVAGMYDLVNNVFYTNQGTGEFIVGPDVN